MYNIAKLGSDWVSFTMAAGVVTTQSTSLVRVLAFNPLRQAQGRTVRSLAAPGSWLPGAMGNWLKNPTYQRVSRIPGLGMHRE
jgi:hypothetical protein